MDLNLIPIYPKQQINKIFPDINFDNFNYKAETNLMTDESIINDNLEQFDKLFNGKRSRNSSYDDNDFQKICLYKSNLNTPSSGLKFNFNKKENNNINNNINIEVNNNQNNCNNIIENNDNKNVDNKKNKITKKILFNSFQTSTLKEIQNQKQKQKMKNKLSARKSRLKKKLYVEKLEKEYVLVKKELEEMKKKFSLNSNNF